jgi:large subunit ribosomal protein L6
VDYAVPAGHDRHLPQEPTEVTDRRASTQQQVGQVAAEHSRCGARPEPYKGKGIRYKDEYIFRKEGKKK